MNNLDGIPNKSTWEEFVNYLNNYRDTNAQIIAQASANVKISGVFFNYPDRIARLWNNPKVGQSFQLCIIG